MNLALTPNLSRKSIAIINAAIVTTELRIVNADERTVFQVSVGDFIMNGIIKPIMQIIAAIIRYDFLIDCIVLF